MSDMVRAEGAYIVAGDKTCHRQQGTTKRPNCIPSSLTLLACQAGLCVLLQISCWTRSEPLLASFQFLNPCDNGVFELVITRD